MTSPERFEQLSTRLAAGVAARDEFVGLALLGSAARSGVSRRDEWSDHDFFAVTSPGLGSQVRPDLSWLPDQDRLVLTAREGEIGFVAVYDDGHVFEFAFSDAAELAGAVAGDATVVVDTDGSTAALIAAARERAAAADVFDPANDARLVLVKLLIGVGRARRGETLVAGSFVRQWAVQHLVRALRGRFGDRSTAVRDTIDPCGASRSTSPVRPRASRTRSHSPSRRPHVRCSTSLGSFSNPAGRTSPREQRMRSRDGSAGGERGARNRKSDTGSRHPAH